jgi:hypothetical protein
MRSSGKQTIAFPYFVPDKQQKQIASGSHRIAGRESPCLTSESMLGYFFWIARVDGHHGMPN